jgi:hypothetical protein
MAVIASLVIHRPKLGAARATVMNEQPIPLRAVGKAAQKLAGLEKQKITVEGCLRRRCYSHEKEPRWGQVEVWVEDCRPVSAEEEETHE